VGGVENGLASRSGQAVNRLDLNDRAGVELAIATICLDGFGDENFEPAFELIPQIGIENVEFNVWYPRNLPVSGIEGIQQRCYEQGLFPVCLQGSAFGESAVKDVAHKLWLMEQTKQLGCRRVKFTGARRGQQGGLDTVIEVLKELAPAAEEMDVLVLVENHANNNIENIDDYDRIFEAVPSSHVGMCLDMGHFDGASVSNFDVIDRFHERIYHIDLKDTIEFGTYKTVNYGEGATDVAGIVEQMIALNYSGYLVVEQAPPLDPDNLLADMRRARSLFEKYEK
jgi:sugar phosphate isomerase/epimerase